MAQQTEGLRLRRGAKPQTVQVRIPVELTVVADQAAGRDRLSSARSSL